MSIIFVSHASEDKEAFVRPLVHALKRAGLKVWYDELSLRPGDSLRRSIDLGLSECTAGLIVLSPAFFAKEWPKRELDALFTSELVGRTKLIPVWYNIDLKAVVAASPLLADRFALKAEIGVESIASTIAEEFPPQAKISGTALAQIIEQYEYPGMFAGEAQLKGCEYRFLQLNAFKEEYGQVLEEALPVSLDQDLEDFSPETTQWLNTEEKRLRIKHRIPEDVYLTTYEPILENHLASYMNDLREWVSGTLSTEDSTKFVLDLDQAELDEYYILLEVPNFSISGDQRLLLEDALIEIGCGYEDEYRRVGNIRTKLRGHNEGGQQVD